MRLKIQTKLMLAVALVVALVAGMVISMTEEKVRETYRRLAVERFEAQVDQFLAGRKARLEDLEENLDRLASSDWVRKVFAKGDFSKKALAEFEKTVKPGMGEKGVGGLAKKPVRPLGEFIGKRQVPGGLVKKRLVCLVDGKGRLHPLSGVSFRRGMESRAALKEFSGVGNVGVRQAGYLVSETDGGESRLVEVVVAPVYEEEGGEVLGAALMGMMVDFSEKPAARGENWEAPPMGGKPLLAGVLAEGEVFSSGLSAQLKESIRLAVAESLEPGEDRLRQEVVLKHGGDPYRLFCERLNPGGTLPPAYQVVLYPLAQLQSDLTDLRLKGSGVGAAAMWLGVLLAWLVSRRFAKPIRELAVATEQIRGGNYEVSVPVRSKDEVGALAQSFNQMAGELKTKEQIRDVLGKVADEAVAEALISGSLELGGETREVSVLFCDIRGFTTLSEAMEPTKVIELLNEHMTAMTKIVYEHRGVVDKFVGDEIMAVFGAPKTYGDDAVNAAQCALRMLGERIWLNQQSGHPFEVGIGVATGSVVVSCIGSMDRLNYTVIGERVNRAARLCGLAGPRQVVVDETTWRMIADQACGSEIENVNLKGYSGEVKAFLLEGMGEEVGTGLTQSR
jgi:class 3 adenylate cyclase